MKEKNKENRRKKNNFRNEKRRKILGLIEFNEENSINSENQTNFSSPTATESIISQISHRSSIVALMTDGPKKLPETRESEKFLTINPLHAKKSSL